jgi:hypothetical protein
MDEKQHNRKNLSGWNDTRTGAFGQASPARQFAVASTTLLSAKEALTITCRAVSPVCSDTPIERSYGYE